ncbi:MAG: DNA polymerase Y family protein [Chitinophagaceae bacterium]|nr:MAG: DNA polymerase Y family protein [Chitinophagaceae bacterium]
MARFVSIWFRHLLTDWNCRRQPELRNKAIVLKANSHGRAIVTALNQLAIAEGLSIGMSVVDAKAIVRGLEILDNVPGLPEKILTSLGRWCIRFTPIVAVDGTDGLLLDATGCAHLWGGEEKYISDLEQRLTSFNYDVKLGMADTVGAAWAISRYSGIKIISPGGQATALLSLPPSALRLTSEITQLLERLGLSTIGTFIGMSRHMLQRRFGQQILDRIDQALGRSDEFLQPIESIIPYRERLPCLEPIQTRTGIEIALHQLLETLCLRLQREGLGLRVAVLKCYRIDGDIQQIAISTSRASQNVKHLFDLFELKLQQLEPGLGIELFVIDATKVEDAVPIQERLWSTTGDLEDRQVAELLDRLEVKFGKGRISRYLPSEHHLPELSVQQASSLKDKPAIPWRVERPRPVRLLPQPEIVEVSAPIPDYPPMLFRYKGELHRIKKADGPERIESEWWHKPGVHRDYYVVEDEQGRRYWLFRLGHYDAGNRNQWFIHGFFA